ncbi:hypothetical protein OH807_36570 [Kitasatospora sp. NBC_01560]|uniref:hypothetical protein n=1 Tax=Kitasatospora sp. NBC_01560 TaxID=2975965 RepID=UPI00386DC8D0
MPGLMLHFGAVMMCAHPPGLVNMPAPSQVRVLVGAQPVATVADRLLVAGCALTAAGTPCATVTWLMTSTRVFVNGLPVLLQPTPPPSPGIAVAVGSPPPNPPMVQFMQTRVLGM